jgi:hypothetical protein
VVGTFCPRDAPDSARATAIPLTARTVDCHQCLGRCLWRLKDCKYPRLATPHATTYVFELKIAIDLAFAESIISVSTSLWFMCIRALRHKICIIALSCEPDTRNESNASMKSQRESRFEEKSRSRETWNEEIKKLIEVWNIAVVKSVWCQKCWRARISISNYPPASLLSPPRTVFSIVCSPVVTVSCRLKI